MAHTSIHHCFMIYFNWFLLIHCIIQNFLNIFLNLVPDSTSVPNSPILQYLIVDSITYHAQDSSHNSPNSFRVSINQLISTMKMFGLRYYECISLFTIKVGLCPITYPVSMITLFLPYLPQWKQGGNIYNSIPAPKFPLTLSNDCISSFWNFTCIYNVCCKSTKEVCC